MPKKTLTVIALLAGLAATAPAHAGLSQNGLSQNGLSAIGSPLDQLDGVAVEAVTLPGADR